MSRPAECDAWEFSNEEDIHPDVAENHDLACDLHDALREFLPPQAADAIAMLLAARLWRHGYRMGASE